MGKIGDSINKAVFKQNNEQNTKSKIIEDIKNKVNNFQSEEEMDNFINEYLGGHERRLKNLVQANEDIEDIKNSIIRNENPICVDRALISRYSNEIYYNSIYLDFDDTLVVENRVNAYLVMFIYQAINKGKKIFLLSKHEDEIENTLWKYRISKNLFDEIIIIDKNEEKSDYIENKDSIFIDDSFSERKKVKKNCGIPVFDLDMIESLVDWRCL